MVHPLAPQAEYRCIVFALCYFHAAMLERKKVRAAPFVSPV